MTAAQDPVQPHATGMLEVGDGHELYWEVCGNPDGKPAVVLHGGPGSGCSPGHRRLFDLDRYQIALFDQRNAGRSRPYAGDPHVDLSTNTTQHLVGDIERLRVFLGIDRWLVYGISWGTTLGLAYAEEYPERVSEIVLNSVVTTTRAEIEWLTRAMGRVFPREWEQFVGGLAETDREGDLAAAYSRLLHDPDAEVRAGAAAAWCAWEDTHVGTYPGHQPNPRYADPAFRLCFARIVTHYFRHAGFLDDGALMRNADRLAGIPGVLIHGRLDISGPPDIPWQLNRVWPGSELLLLDDVGHGGTSEAVRAATDRFAGRV